MTISIITYNRPEMLSKQLNHCKDHNVYVFDDCSDTFPDDLTGCNHYMSYDQTNGKEGHWRIWDDVLRSMKRVNDDLFIFMPDDFLNLDFDRVNYIHKKLINTRYCCNLINDGRDQNFQRYPVSLEKIGKEDVKRVGWTDCGFFTNKYTLDRLGYFMIPIVPSKRYSSSGVGRQLTSRLRDMNTAFYVPIKSLAYHGDHESKMHPNERKHTPLISR